MKKSSFGKRSDTACEALRIPDWNSDERFTELKQLVTVAGIAIPCFLHNAARIVSRESGR
jgi:hypothetical protein